MMYFLLNERGGSMYVCESCVHYVNVNATSYLDIYWVERKEVDVNHECAVCAQKEKANDIS